MIAARTTALAAALIAALAAAIPVPAAAAASPPRRVAVFDGPDATARARVRLERAGIDVDGAGLNALAFTAPDATVNALAGVTFTGVDHVVAATDVPNDPCYTSCPDGNQNYLDVVGAERAWSRAKADGVTIAVIDAGVDFSHPDLDGKNAGELNFTDEPGVVEDHGTKVAGLAAAETNNGRGIAALGWNARILSLKVLEQDGSGFESWVAEALDEAVRQGAQVINLSLAGPAYNPQILGAAVSRAVNSGAVIVAAAGNDDDNTPLTEPTYPAALPGVIAVAATANADLAPFSKRGPWVDIAAPGSQLLTTTLAGGYSTATGTSAAAPLVAGAAALLVAQGIDVTSQQVAARLGLTGVPIQAGLRRMNAGDALLGGYPYSPAWGGGARVATGDLLPDPGIEIVTAAGPGGGPHVRVFRADGTPLGGGFMAYDARFNLGIDVAVGNLDNDPEAEIVTGVNPGGGPHIRVFDADGTPRGGGFMAYNPAFTGGVRVAVGDVDAAHAGNEIVTAAGPGGGPHVGVFTADGAPLGGGFMAYDPAMNAGLQVAVGDLVAGGVDEIVTGAGAGAGPHVRVFRGDGSPFGGGFFAYDPRFGAGIDVAAGDVVGGGTDEIVTGPGPGGGPHIQAFRADGANLRSFYVLDPAITAGLSVAASADGYLVTTLGRPSVFRFAPPTA